jgi:hypothetical protein
VGTGAFSTGLKHAGLEADYLPQSGKDMWCYTSIPALILIIKANEMQYYSILF